MCTKRHHALPAPHFWVPLRQDIEGRGAGGRAECNNSSMLGLCQVSSYASLVLRAVPGIVWHPVQCIYRGSGYPTGAHDGRSADGVVQQYVLGGHTENWTPLMEVEVIVSSIRFILYVYHGSYWTGGGK